MPGTALQRRGRGRHSGAHVPDVLQLGRLVAVKLVQHPRPELLLRRGVPGAVGRGLGQAQRLRVDGLPQPRRRLDGLRELRGRALSRRDMTGGASFAVLQRRCGGTSKRPELRAGNRQSRVMSEGGGGEGCPPPKDKEGLYPMQAIAWCRGGGGGGLGGRGQKKGCASELRIRFPAS